MPTFGIYLHWPNSLEDKWNEIKKLAGEKNRTTVIVRVMLEWLERQQSIRTGEPIGPIKSMNMVEAVQEIKTFSVTDHEEQLQKLSGLCKLIRQESGRVHALEIKSKLINLAKAEIKFPQTTTLSDDTGEEVVTDEEEEVV